MGYKHEPGPCSGALTPDKLPDPTPRRGRPLKHPENDLRTAEEVEWWNKNVAEPLAQKRRPLPLARVRLGDAWLYDAEQLFKELDGVREIILRIPETLETRSALQSAIDRIWRLKEDLCYLLSLQREGQRAFARKHGKKVLGKVVGNIGVVKGACAQ